MKGNRWTQELELELVKLYKKFRCLWMMSLPTYNDLDRRYSAYVTIVEALKPGFRSLTVPKVVYKIRDLRYRYCVELTKMERAHACEEYYTPNLLWFTVMHSFLDLRFRTEGVKDSDATDYSSERKLQDSIYSRTTGLTSSGCQTIYKSRLKMEESESTVGEFKESDNDAVNCTDDVCSDLRRSCMEAAESGEVEEIEDHPVDLSEMNTRGPKCASEIKLAEKNREESDEFDAFAVSIGSQLKRLDPGLATKLEIRILMILKEERTKSGVLML